ncbi:macrophage mannose receptor 1-like [Anneissia japonica]|uniref:macrophage mannose receptor 1-like n=1 Tax=Anneissia japonica TaxID=1529436 RepID=UPI001425A8A2|nr:macrophage mannose receptor 1-like [Anneissia japonica]
MGCTVSFYILCLIAVVSRDVASLSTETNCDLSTAVCITPSLCQEGWSYSNKRCYRTVSTSASFREAQSMCNLVKGYLPVIANSDENSFIASAEGGTTKWIGLSDIIQENTFIWNDERKASTSYVNWGSGQPDSNSASEDCVEIVPGQYYWNDIDCTHSKYSICEMDLTPRQWYPWGYSIYLFNTRGQKCSHSRTSCEDVGANLVVIGDSSENSFIGSMVSSLGMGDIWIGLNDISSEGTYVWPDSGETSTYTYWLSGQPNNYNGIQDTVKLVASSYLWNDWEDTTYHYASICEKGIEWEYFNGKKYFATDYRLSASDAIARCNDIGGYLAVITSDEENSFLVDMITKTHYSQREFYIDYVSDADAVWSWRDSSGPVFSNWDEGEGLAASACAALSLADGQWVDVDCSALHGFICEAEITWIPWHNEKYYINTTPLPYDKAREVCQKIGGDVVSYDTLEEQKVVESLMLRTSIIKTKYKNVYIGNYKEADGFKWARTGTTSSLSNWCSGEPSGGSEYCTEFRSSDNCYNDISCSTFRASICEADIHPTDGALWEQRRYFVNRESVTYYSTAKSRCNEMGMELASITSQYEMDVVLEAIRLAQGSGSNYYIGYNDITTEGTYVWDSSSAQILGYEPWKTSAVFGDSKDCTILRSSSSYLDWASVSCSNNYYHVCELEGADNYEFVKDGVAVHVDPNERNTCVEGHTLREIEVRSLIECMASCLLESGCLSLNYYSKPPYADVTNCKLKDILRSDYPRDVFTMRSCEYYDFK